MTTYTTNFNFALPDFDKKPWHQDMADIVTTIDAVLARYVSANNMQGVWQNSTAYAVGERTVDEDDGTIWTCLVVHTSSPTGTTFAVARTTYPTYWEVFSDVELAKNWATYLAGTVDGSDYSSKAYAIGSILQLPAGSAKYWSEAATADAVLTAADAVSTAADVISTNADVGLTHADVVSTAADVVTTTQDAIDTAADAVSTNADVGTTAASAAAAAASAATVPAYDSVTGEALKYVRLNAAETAMEFRTAAQSLTDLGAEAADADILKADTADTLTAGFNATENDAGTKTTGTFTPDPADGNFQKAVNGGAHTLAPPATTCSIVIQYTNNASAGAITTSGFTLVDGDTISTTNADDFFFFIVRNNGFSSLTVKALQ
jgi:hypothetical protein